MANQTYITHVSQITLCSVCVNTYKRPVLLKNLLESLVAQQLDDDVRLEVIVVDNEPEGNGRFVVEPFIKDASIHVEYHHEPIKNISLARNQAVSAAKGEYILFVDDDEEASPTWVQTMLNAVRDHDADAAFGRVVPIFNEQAPEYLKGSYIYHRQCDPTGTPAKIGRTSNAIVKAAWLQEVEGPFDPIYGVTGGEDSHLFNRLFVKGARFIDCYEGVVTEYMPPERTTEAWLRNRSLRTGMLYSWRKIRSSKSPAKAKISIVGKATAAIAFTQLMRLAHFPNRAKRLHWGLKTAAYQGHIQALFEKPFDGY